MTVGVTIAGRKTVIETDNGSDGVSQIHYQRQ